MKILYFILHVVIFHSIHIFGKSRASRIQLQREFSSLFQTPIGSAAEGQDIDEYPMSQELQDNFKSVLRLVAVDEPFAMFKTEHMKAFRLLLQTFRDAGDAKDMLRMAAIFKEHPKMNRKLWINALISASILNQDLRDLNRPHILSPTTDDYIYRDAMPQTIRQKELPENQKSCVVIDGSYGEDNGEENALWYFREDLLANAQHHFWHMVQHAYIISNEPQKFDRNGELFYYFHHNMLARYDAERLSNGLERITPLELVEGEIVEQQYNPHLEDMNTPSVYLPRPANTVLQDLKKYIDVRRVILDDVKARRLIATNGSKISLDNMKGVDLIGDFLEALGRSLNPERYLKIGLHNCGHVLVGELCPGAKEPNKTIPVMWLPATSARDPLFYKWHKLVDNVFALQHSLLRPHHATKELFTLFYFMGEFPLVWKGVAVSNFNLRSDWHFWYNELKTRMGKLRVNIPMFGDALIGPEYAEYCITRLKHTPFRYTFNINVDKSIADGRATVRIFMAPRLNEYGRRIPYEKQRLMFFPMVHFVVNLSVGTNYITRYSQESSLVLNWNLKEWETDTPTVESPNCGCGHPAHLLLRRGNEAGMEFDVFIIVTEFAMDDALDGDSHVDEECKMSGILFGNWNPPKYPDSRPMGYPFDRRFEGVNRFDRLDEFVEAVPNSNAVKVKIFHEV